MLVPNMPSRCRTTTALLAICAIAASACSDTATGPDRDLLVTTSGPVRFYTGETTSVTVTVTNNSTTRTYQIDQNGCEDPFTVATTTGSPFPVRSYLCNLSLPAPRALPPGQSLYLTRDWAGAVGSASDPSNGTPLPPGTYLVRGFVRVADGTVVESTAPLTTQIVPRSSAQ